MRVRSRDVMHRQLFWLGEYEPETTALFRSLLRPGQTVLDIGANVGYFTLIAAEAVGPSGRVVAFEPVEENLRLLRDNLRINGLANVEVETSAVADANATERIYLYRKDVNSGMGSLMGSEADVGVEQRSVATTTVDEYLRRARAERVDVIKMDIQGCEGKALDGMLGLLAREAAPVLLWEINPRVLAEYGDSAARLVGLLEERGYSNFAVGARRLIPVDTAGVEVLPESTMLVSSRCQIALPGGWRIGAE
jgi:FkbM family methyltransferase